ncbi:ABC transporter permease [Flagellimonas marinaquae]|uniref:ABC transporter permease n=1 Tax=Flagellimonas aurea TaxID=2915619 RepID=A0ABS3G721_9FLAO|nr:ABC transporter permease [Allomuricauda aurea]MAO16937.1 ABC transporter permease [Allomuricauda sp.]MBO0355215.1 ABC transporter permease [Allomuricauda aurea]UBZ15143.1 ABC transporter permease [Allomuricauda aquimarina]|tara:strand:- start:859 stop:1596 length:738 start_codon:yes stop_codon:yes gene_type:complete
MKYLEAIGKYFIMIWEVFKKPTKWRIMKTLILKEVDELVFGAMGIIIFISFFIGGVVTIQTALNLTNPLLPKSLIGFAARQSVILEFAPTFTSIIMAGKVGSYITSSIGTMRVTEQIDALEVMGINSLNYLVFPKIVAIMLYPFAVAISMFVGILGGWVAAVFGGFAPSGDFIQGLQMDFNSYHVTYALIKSVVFAFVIATVPSFHGFYMTGGALEVGKASTTSFVWTSVVIIIVNYILTQLLLG